MGRRCRHRQGAGQSAQCSRVRSSSMRACMMAG
jgi:hypothetical protein